MIGLWNANGKGLITMYVLYSLSQEPKTGYEIIKEIKEKTKSKWVPSKGTIYPLLKKLNNEELITIKSNAERSKNIFKVTSKGNKLLKEFHKKRINFKERFDIFKELFSDLFSKDKKEIINLLVEVKEQSLNNKASKKKIIKILSNCINELSEASK